VGPVRAVAILGVLAFSSGVSAQQSADEQAARRLDEAERQYRELDFEGTVATARAALTISGVGDAVRLRAYEILGAAFVVLEREAEATEAFREMLAIDPYHRVHEATGSPKIENFVEALRTRLVPDAPSTCRRGCRQRFRSARGQAKRSPWARASTGRARSSACSFASATRRARRGPR